MKYVLLVVVGLILFATDLPTPARDDAAPLLPLNASASFATTQAGTTTEVGLDVYDPSAPIRLSIFISRHRQACTRGACQEVSVIDASTIQAVAPDDAAIERQLQGGDVHSTFQLHDTASNATLTVRVDADWTGQGPVVCAATDAGAACMRGATVLAAVASGAEDFVAADSVLDGQISWREAAP